MFSFHKPKVYRSSTGCCICRAKSSSSRFTDSKKYEEDFVECFKLHERRTGEICNACVLLVKRWKKLPAGSERNWRHVVDARAGPGTKSLTKFKSKNKKKPKLKAEAIPVASSLGSKVNVGGSNLVNHSSVSMGGEKSKKKHMYMKSHNQRNSGVSSSMCKAALAGGNIPPSDRQRNHYRGIVRDSSPSALSDIGGEEDFLSDHSPSPSPSDLGGLVDARRKNHRIKPKLRAGSSPKQQQTRIQRSVVRHGIMNRDDDEEEEEDPEEEEDEEEEEEEEDEEEEMYEEITRRKRSQRGFPVALHHQRSSRNRSRSPVQRQTGERKCNPSRRSQVAVSPQISSFLDMTFWKREEVCCGIIFKGPNEEVIVDPRFLKPCIGCRKPLIMEGSDGVQSAPAAIPPADSPQLQSPPPALYPPTSSSRGIPPASSSQNGGLTGPASSSGTKQSAKSFSDSSSDSGYDESSNPGADGNGLNANRRPSAGVIVSAGEVNSMNIVGADLGGIMEVPYPPAIIVAAANNYIPKSRPSPGEGIAPSND
ncbi:formin-E-like [Hetaerina americana]|uniref:formin-E-like n=1 Tax=Hetaerina americana TaxID=62018 RepID=UPI003A7F2AAC